MKKIILSVFFIVSLFNGGYVIGASVNSNKHKITEKPMLRGTHGEVEETKACFQMIESVFPDKFEPEKMNPYDINSITKKKTK